MKKESWKATSYYPFNPIIFNSMKKAALKVNELKQDEEFPHIYKIKSIILNR